MSAQLIFFIAILRLLSPRRLFKFFLFIFRILLLRVIKLPLPDLSGNRRARITGNRMSYIRLYIRPWRIMPAEKLAEFGTSSGKFHACLVCGERKRAEFEELHAIRFVWFCQFHCFSSITSGASQGPHSFNLVFVCLFVCLFLSRLALSRICPVPYRTAGHLLAPVSVLYRTVPSNTAGYKQLATILCTCIRLPVCCNCA